MTTGHDIAMSIRAAYLAMHRQTDAHLAAFGVTADQFVVLAILTEFSAATQQQLVRRASSDPNTMRAMLMLLERRGLVARERHPTDGRARSVSLTPEGRRTYQRLSAAVKPLQDLMLGLFGAGEATTLVQSLMRISGTLTEAAGVPERQRPSPFATDAAN